MGMPGFPGINGVPGVQGPQGSMGLPGLDGCNGTDVSKIEIPASFIALHNYIETGSHLRSSFIRRSCFIFYERSRTCFNRKMYALTSSCYCNNMDWGGDASTFARCVYFTQKVISEITHMPLI